MLTLVVLVLIHYLKHFGEVLAEMVRSSTLNTTATDRNVEFNCSSVLSTCETLIFRLTSSDDRAGQELFVDLSIDFLNLVLEHGSVLFSSVGSVTFLPEELTSADERSRVLELPSDDIGPLVKEQRQVTMRPNPFSIGRVHDCLGSRPDSDRLRHLTLSRLGNPSDLGSEARYMVLLLIKRLLSHKHGEVAVLHAVLLEKCIGEVCNLFPDEERVRA